MFNELVSELNQSWTTSGLVFLVFLESLEVLIVQLDSCSCILGVQFVRVGYFWQLTRSLVLTEASGLLGLSTVVWFWEEAWFGSGIQVIFWCIKSYEWPTSLVEINIIRRLLRKLGWGLVHLLKRFKLILHDLLRWHDLEFGHVIEAVEIPVRWFSVYAASKLSKLACLVLLLFFHGLVSSLWVPIT